MNNRKSPADTHGTAPRNTCSPCLGDLHSEVEDWRRRTRNIGTAARNSHKSQASQLLDFKFKSGLLCRPDTYSPRPQLYRNPQSIKINLNFPVGQPDISSLQHQLTSKQHELDELWREYQHYKGSTERKLQTLTRTEYSQRECIANLQQVVRELKARLLERTLQKAEAVLRVPSFSKNQGCGGVVVLGEVVREGRGVQTEEVGAKARGMQTEGVGQLHQSVSVDLLDSQLETLKLACKELQQQKSALTSQVQTLQCTIQQLQLQLQQTILQAHSKLYVNEISWRLQIQHLQSQAIRLQNQSVDYHQIRVQYEAMRELISEQQHRLGELQEIRAQANVLLVENTTLAHELVRAEKQEEELRKLKEEVSEVKSHNLQLVVQSANEVDCIRRIAELSHKIDKAIGRAIRQSQSSSEVSNPLGQQTESRRDMMIDAQRVGPQKPQEIRIEDSFETDGLTSHQAHLKLVEELSVNLTSILAQVEQFKDDGCKRQLADLKEEVDSLNKQLDQERLLTNQLLLQTKQQRRTIDELNTTNEELSKKCAESQHVDKEKQRKPRRNNRLKTVNVPNQRELNTIEQKPQSQENCSQIQSTYKSSSRTGGSLKLLRQTNKKPKPYQQLDQFERNESDKQQKEDKQNKIEQQAAPQRRESKRSRPSICIQQTDTLQIPIITLNGSPISSLNLLSSANIRQSSRMNLKAMSFKQLSYTLLADFADKNDQKAQFASVIEQLVSRYFEPETTIGRTVLTFLSQLDTFPDHAFLLERADILLQELMDYSHGARQEVAALEQAIEDYIENAKPVFEGAVDQFFEEEEQNDESDDDGEVRRPKRAQRDDFQNDDLNLDHENGQALQPADLNSLTELLTQGLNTTIEKLRRGSSVSSRSSCSSASSVQ